MRFWERSWKGQTALAAASFAVAAAAILIASPAQAAAQGTLPGHVAVTLAVFVVAVTAFNTLSGRLRWRIGAPAIVVLVGATALLANVAS